MYIIQTNLIIAPSTALWPCGSQTSQMTQGPTLIWSGHFTANPEPNRGYHFMGDFSWFTHVYPNFHANMFTVNMSDGSSSMNHCFQMKSIEPVGHWRCLWNKQTMGLASQPVKQQTFSLQTEHNWTFAHQPAIIGLPVYFSGGARGWDLKTIFMIRRCTLWKFHTV